VVLNTLPGESGVRGLQILRTFGRFIQVDKQDIFQGSGLVLTPFQNGLTFTAVDVSLLMKAPKRIQPLFKEIMDHLGEGHFAPVRTTAFPFEKLKDALTLMSRFQHTGKLVLTYD